MTRRGHPVLPPPLLLLTDRSQLPPGRSLTETIAACVDAGLRAVVVRERDLEDRERAELVFDLRQVLAPVGGTPLVAAPDVGRPDGVLLRDGEAVPRSRPRLLGRSCHSRDGLHRATRDECDFVTLSPVAESPSKPGYGPPLGRAGLHALTRPPATPAATAPAVFALGGVTAGNAGDWVASGAHGVAVMGALMRANDPAAVTAAILTDLNRQRPRLEEA